MKEFQVGDRVRVGKGAKLWRITEFWTVRDTALASLVSADGGYTNASASVDRLTLVEES